MPKIIINTQSIRNELRNYQDKPANAILEYIWNGFDAGANNVYINYSFQKDASGISFGYPDFEIYDDGLGWDVENLKSTKLFLVSSKQHFSHKSLPQGRDGVGRFTFYAFASKASWFTICNGNKYKLSLESDSLDDYKLESDSVDIDFKVGTKVVFNVSSSKLTDDFFDRDLVSAIQLDFCWLMQLYPQKNIYLNNKLVDFSGSIKKSQSDSCLIEGSQFEIKLVQWNEKPTKESSKFYFINSKGEVAAELVLISHMDADHSSFRPETSIEGPGKNNHKELEYNILFPNLDLRGTLVKEWNGYPNIAWSYNIDGYRLLHLADNVHILTKEQLKNFGRIDILFISPTKIAGATEQTLENIKAINPRAVVWSHHIPVKPCQEADEDKIRRYYKKIFKQNKNAGISAVNAFAGFFLNILEINKAFDRVINIDASAIEITNSLLKTKNKQPVILFFRKTAAK